MGAAAENDLLEQTLADRWRIVERIGHGAMGEVWRGKHALLGHEVAIKLMRPEAAKDRNLVARFKREARIAAQLRHRNLVRVEDFGVTADGRPFLVMEFLKGRTLGKFLEETPRPTLPTVLKIVQQIGAALDAAHAEGIVHRDLKPDNCHLVADDDGGLLVKVLDFGIAKVTDGMFGTANGVVTAAQALLGTPMYMSPEQARGDADVDKRSDLWSVGVMAFEMLTGRMPFDAPSVSQVLLQVLNAQVPSASSMEPSLSPSVDAWFARALAREKPQRFQTGRELSSSLATVLGLAHPTPSLVPAVHLGGGLGSLEGTGNTLAAGPNQGYGERVSGPAPAPYGSLPPTSMTPMVSMAAVTGRGSAVPSPVGSVMPFGAHGSGQHGSGQHGSGQHGAVPQGSSPHGFAVPAQAPYGPPPQGFGGPGPNSSTGMLVPKPAPGRSTLAGGMGVGVTVSLAVAALFAVGMASLALARVTGHAPWRTERVRHEVSAVNPVFSTAPSGYVPVPAVPTVPMVPVVPVVPTVPSAFVPTPAHPTASATPTTPAAPSVLVAPSAQRATGAASASVAPTAAPRGPRAGGRGVLADDPYGPTPSASAQRNTGSQGDPPEQVGFPTPPRGNTAHPSAGEYNPDMP